MGNETRWPRSAVSFDALPSQKGGLHPARSGVYTEEEVGGRAVLCDCHCGPMYYFPVSLMPKSDFVMCWVSECGPRRCCASKTDTTTSASSETKARGQVSDASPWLKGRASIWQSCRAVGTTRLRLRLRGSLRS
jgi:hypothetical protein